MPIFTPNNLHIRLGYDIEGLSDDAVAIESLNAFKIAFQETVEAELEPAAASHGPSKR